MNNISESHSDRSQIVHPLLGQRLDSALEEIHFESQISVNLPAFLTHHRVNNIAIMPAAAYVEIVLAAGAAMFKSDDWVVEDFVIQQALMLPENEVQTVQLILTPEASNASSFQLFSLATGKDNQDLSRTLHASGRLFVKEPDRELPQKDLVRQAQCMDEISVAAYYQQCRDRGIDYGSSFQVIEQLWRQEGEALGRIRLPESLASEAEDYRVHPVLLDSCFQVLWASLPESVKEQTYLPVGIERLTVHRRPGMRLWSHARIHRAQVSTQQTLSADLCLFDERGVLVIEIEGLFVERASNKVLLRHLQKKQTMAIAATFTAEPVEDSLVFWMQELEIPSQIKFAPYNQVFQELLNPASLLAGNQDGVNVLLVRFEDWERTENRLQLNVDLFEKERVLADQRRYTLPNRVEIAHLNQYETEYLYQELFVDQVYLKHGIVLNDGDCVVDVGANIGLFTLFAQQKCPNATIYAFEPAPHAFKNLQSNATLYCKNANLFNCGLAAENKEETFTFYPHSSVFSSFAADTEQDEKAIRAVILNMLQRDNCLEKEELEALADEFLTARLERETYTAQLRTLSSAIQEHNIERIDLLKLDAEKSELAVLQGIADNDWSIIKQIVVEVHDQEGSVIEQVTRLVKEKGFELFVDEENLLQGSGLYNIYATRPSQEAKLSPEKPVANTAEIQQNVRELGNALKTAAARSATPYLICVCPASPTAVADSDRSTLYQQMEKLLASELGGVSGMYLVKTSELAATYPVSKYYDPHGDKFGHVPYTPAFFTALGTAIARKINAIKSATYKVIALDCDGTLWKGVCGEDGANGIEISSPYKALQEFMVAQHDAGMLICLCSKNNEEDVLAVFDRRPEMSLKRDRLVSWRINWQPKSENIKSLANELQLGLDSFIFVEDNPIECAEVQNNCPEVLTLQLPPEPDRIPQFLDHIWAFDRLNSTQEDKQRTALYKQNIQRESFRKETLTFNDFLAGLGLEVCISPMAAHQLVRVSQLTQRTNQFNLTTIRRSEGEIEQLCESGKFECLVIEVSDRFGDYGLVGALLFKAVADAISVDTFLLSCRALGRGVEHEMLAKLGEIAKARGLNRVDVSYVQTPKNQPALDFLQDIGAAFKQELGSCWLFKFPADFASELSYNPEVTKLVQRSPSTINLQPSTVNRKKQSLTLNRIATELYDAEQVLKVIESQQQRIRPELKENFVAPSNDIETALVDIWSEVLKLERMGIYDNFFDLGGSSLLMVRVHSKLKERFDRDISPVNLFRYPTINALAQYLSSNPQSLGAVETTYIQQVNDRVQRQKEARRLKKQLREQARNE